LLGMCQLVEPLLELLTLIDVNFVVVHCATRLQKPRAID
jgi:hypothetical protein